MPCGPFWTSFSSSEPVPAAVGTALCRDGMVPAPIRLSAALVPSELTGLSVLVSNWSWASLPLWRPFGELPSTKLLSPRETQQALNQHLFNDPMEIQVKLNKRDPRSPSWSKHQLGHLGIQHLMMPGHPDFIMGSVTILVETKKYSKAPPFGYQTIHSKKLGFPQKFHVEKRERLKSEASQRRNFLGTALPFGRNWSLH